MGRGPDASASGGRYFLGLDGGQSHTTVLIGNESGRVVGIGSAGPTNRGGSEDARARTEAAIGEALARALDDAGLDGTTRFAAACCGMSGGAETARELLSRHIQTEQTEQTEPLEVVTDAQIALWGATECAPGIVVIAGTGSIAWGEDRAGKTARAGGWGYAFGDEGGGFDIVRRAMRTGLKAEEGWGPETSLRELFLEHSRASTMNDLLHRFYAEGLPRDGIAALAPLVDQAAEGGDEGAREILLGAGAGFGSARRCGARAIVRCRRDGDDRVLGWRVSLARGACGFSGAGGGERTGRRLRHGAAAVAGRRGVAAGLAGKGLTAATGFDPGRVIVGSWSRAGVA